MTRPLGRVRARSLLPFGTGLVGVVGGYLLLLPLPALMGPMLVNAGCALSGMSMRIPQRMMPTVFIVIGWYLGSRVTPDILDSMRQWWFAAILMIFWTLLTASIGVFYFTRISRYDRRAAVFASLPGALSNIVATIEDIAMDQKRVIVPQTVRVFFVVGILPIIFSSFLPTTDLLAGDGDLFFAEAFPFITWGLCLLATLVLVFLFRRAYVPTPEFLAGTIAAGIFYGTGFLVTPLPAMFVLAAFYFLGCFIGSRFTGATWRELIVLGKHGVVVALLMIFFSVPGALLASLWLDLRLFSLILAYIPGGIHEMSIIAAAYDLDPLFVATMHFIRIVFIILSLPFLFRLMSSNSSR